MMRFCLTFATSCLLLLSMPLAAAERKWTSADGQFAVEATLVKLTDQAATLLKKNGNTTTVLLAQLSAADRQLLDGLPLDASARVLHFLVTERLSRPLELRRIEKRLKELQADLKAGAKDAKNPLLNQATIAKSAKQVATNLEARQRALKADKPLVPRLSPSDLDVGQIGQWDDDVIASNCRIEANGLAIFTVLHEEFQYETRLPGRPAVWVRGIVSRPSSFGVRGALVGQFAPAKEEDQTGPNNRLLHTTIFEVTGREKVGNIWLYVLQPYDAAEVKEWLARRP